MKISIRKVAGSFAENKDIAKEIRLKYINPSIKKNEGVILDFKGVDSSTQSFIHAMISEAFQKNGINALDFFEFKNCNKPIKSLIATVVNYSLE